MKHAEGVVLPTSRRQAHRLDSGSGEELFEKVRHVITEPEWVLAKPLIAEILELKAARGAVILAHNYQSPLIYHGVADITGDSLELARLAAKVEEEVIVLCGVSFMAET